MQCLSSLCIQSINDDDVCLLQLETVSLLSVQTLSTHTGSVSGQFRLILFGHVMRNKSLEQDAQLSQRDRTAGYISFGRKWKTGTQRQYFTDIVSLASTTVT